MLYGMFCCCVRVIVVVCCVAVVVVCCALPFVWLLCAVCCYVLPRVLCDIYLALCTHRTP